MNNADIEKAIDEMLEDNSHPGFKRVGGKLTGNMPQKIVVQKDDRRWGPKGTVYHATEEYSSMGNTKFVSDSGRFRWLDRDDVDLAGDKIASFGVAKA